MAERSMGQMAKCSAKENSNADFRCLEGLLKEKLSTSNLNTNQMTKAGGTTSQFHVLDVEQGQPHPDGERATIWKLPSNNGRKHKRT
jgi:hypothetical protein